MTDLTPLFKKYVDIVQSEIGQSSQSDHEFDKTHSRPQATEKYVISDTFIKEAKDLYNHLVKLNQFTASIRSSYLSTNDDFLNHARSGDILTLEDKNKIDEDFKFKIHELYEKLKFLQTYEKRRQEVAEANKPSGIFNGIFGSADHDDDEAFQTTVGIHRTSILRLLNDIANSVNKKYEEMQKKRYKRERQLNLLNFQNLEDDLDLNYADDTPDFNNNESIDVLELEEANRTATNSDNQALSQEQVQELDSENQEFLALKTNQLKQVEQLHNSMIDIVSLQAELTYQLETQADQITNLLDNQSQVEVDLKLGNQTLHKATNRNKTGANLIIMTCIALGCLILFMDLVSF